MRGVGHSDPGLKERSKLTLTVGIPTLPSDPNLDSPLNGHAATLWNNQPEFKRALLKHKGTVPTGTERRA